jgi:enoyl-[acyl-carrier-protein] reductase (NADH)
MNLYNKMAIIEGAAAYLVSPSAESVTGVAFAIDGGLSI